MAAGKETDLKIYSVGCAVMSVVLTCTAVYYINLRSVLRNTQAHQSVSQDLHRAATAGPKGIDASGGISGLRRGGYTIIDVARDAAPDIRLSELGKGLSSIDITNGTNEPQILLSCPDNTLIRIKQIPVVREGKEMQSKDKNSVRARFAARCEP